MKFILSTTAAVANDLILGTGELAEELGHTGGVYLSQYIPVEARPQGKKAAPLWVDGFSYIFGVVHEMFEEGNIPTIDELERALSQLPKDKQKLIKAYGKKGARLDSVLEALVFGAKEEWENDFKAVHCDGNDWLSLPICTEHDLNWTLVEDMLLD
jgi:hypothetical protein